MERLDKFIASQSMLTRTEAQELLKQGRVTVNGVAQKKYDFKINFGTDKVSIDGNEIVYRKYIYIMMNKPQGVISATEDKAETVLDLVPEEYMRKGLFPAGRLDKDTEGFLIITDDGGFAHNMMSPKKHVEKEYEAVLDEPVSAEEKALFENGGITIDGDACKPAILKIIDKNAEFYTVRAIITEGKYHQVKRMFAAVGKQVLHLKRVRIGQVFLDKSLNSGQCREMSKSEVETILT